MTSRLSKLVAVCLLLLALVQPSRPTATPPKLHPSVLTDWNERAAWLPFQQMLNEQAWVENWQPEKPKPATKPKTVRASGGGDVSGGDIWGALARCESGGDPATNTGNGFYGAFQFTLSTWRSLGYDGLPSEHPYSVQLDAAQALQARSGWGQWPACSKRLGLR